MNPTRPPARPALAARLPANLQAWLNPTPAQIGVVLGVAAALVVVVALARTLSRLSSAITQLATAPTAVSRGKRSALPVVLFLAAGVAGVGYAYDKGLIHYTPPKAVAATPLASPSASPTPSPTPTTHSLLPRALPHAPATLTGTDIVIIVCFVAFAVMAVRLRRLSD
jgi:hypothetical protein